MFSFYLSVLDIFVSILVGERSVCDFNSFTFVEVCFVLQIYLGICLMNTWKNIYSAAFRWSVLEMFIRSCWFMVLLSPSISFMIFCLVVLSVVEKKWLKSATITVDLSISPVCSMSLFLHRFWSCFLSCTHLEYLCHLGRLTFLSLCNLPLCL